VWPVSNSRSIRDLPIQYDPGVDALELIALAAWSFAVSAAGGLVGLVLGNLRLPLVVLLASSPAAGAGANVAISGAWSAAWRCSPRRSSVEMTRTAIPLRALRNGE
jgi:hypothetical protein